MKKQELEDRLVAFSVNIARLTERMPQTPTALYLAKQIVRSASAPALLYGEACAAESAKDFIHKMAIGLKELRETGMNLRMILKNGFASGPFVDSLVDENDQLIAIFWKSIDTAKRNRLNRGDQS
jgi:four helix bundle protein